MGYGDLRCGRVWGLLCTCVGVEGRAAMTAVRRKSGMKRMEDVIGRCWIPLLAHSHQPMSKDKWKLAFVEIGLLLEKGHVFIDFLWDLNLNINAYMHTIYPRILLQFHLYH